MSCACIFSYIYVYIYLCNDITPHPLALTLSSAPTLMSRQLQLLLHVRVFGMLVFPSTFVCVFPVLSSCRVCVFCCVVSMLDAIGHIMGTYTPSNWNY